MQATGIIAEYNPFHNGHLYHIQETKRLTQQPLIVVMSGSFMQRGEPAVLSKWKRASCAVQAVPIWCWSSPASLHCAVPNSLPRALCSF